MILRNTLVVLSLVGFCGATHADTLSQNVTFPSETFYQSNSPAGGEFTKGFLATYDQFNPGLGTLNSISFTLDFDFDVTLLGGGGGSVTGIVYVNDIEDPAFTGGGNGAGGAPGSYPVDQLYEQTITLFGSNGSDMLFDEFIGTGSVDVEAFLSTDFTGVDYIAELISDLGDPYMQLEYDYTPAFVRNGDFNADGKVDLADYTIWRDNLDSDKVLPGDTSPGSVTMEDYDVWKYNFATGAGSLSTVAVPEPMSLVLLAIGLALPVARRTLCAA
ncbi:PEP-CTERM sorting domain-containing protein [Aeoliella mucimassa]|uniref:PEP-CTERM protein-sorting domain-containing protein n=1 Tax=Aeoliella mucimassa TaxID=2527972 RepID=A0A518AHW8_9BACT|nr:PEP-CTERM sorting domain-containing protein [Aeoliella mucimassa]QDU54305.1 hypothetical protein Pan181_04860 [Aeoliella mucimassa]